MPKVVPQAAKKREFAFVDQKFPVGVLNGLLEFISESSAHNQ